ncbi:hypothetical protein DOTSEDRAFT_68930 [Dothistroma septosporum NZE10]|uniref:Major facilitator superfamily (MFS) profile domain-containing protein n=1 Tax=Dothistroma septosporum (strain NZE10 / CBS 128990) TaxID=675120 RepID=N1Q573_DOTSN|nr:hypothetical protein DOTSEDRAFT_68930 [Dothistroma septosporum NZE10]
MARNIINQDDEGDTGSTIRRNYGTHTMSISQEDDHNERMRLLPAQQVPTRPPLIRRNTIQSPRSIMILLLVVIIFTSFGTQLRESPETRILESVICYRYYETADPSRLNAGRDIVAPGAIGGVDEKYCKEVPVQDDLAMLDGYQNFFDGFPALLLALGFGWAADRFGRWPFLFVGLIQITARAVWVQLVAWNWQAFDIRMTWLQSVFALLGGGDATISAYFFTMIADITPEQERAAAFLRAGAANMAANLCMPPLAATLMTLDPWIPAIMGTVLDLLAAVLFLLVPETLDYGRDTSPASTDVVSEPTRQPDDNKPGVTNLLRRQLTAARSAISFLTIDWRVPTLLLPFAAHILIANTGRLVLQYVSKRYALTFAKGTLLVTVRNGVTVLLLFVLLPWLSKAVMRRHSLCSQKKDLYLAQISQGLLALGWVAVGASPTVATAAISLSIASLGTGAALLVRSFLTSLLPSHHIARVYSVISVIDTLGIMFGAPLLAGLFSEGLALGGGWIGMPFYFIGLLSAFFVGLLFVVGLRKGEGAETNVNEAER